MLDYVCLWVGKYLVYNILTRLCTCLFAFGVRLSSIYLCVFVFVYVYMCRYIDTYVWVCMHVYTYIFVCVFCIHVCVCVRAC
jgi:hypothetical protein